MNAIRQYKEVINNGFIVELPDDFKAKRVEIIIIPDEETEELSASTKEIVSERTAHYEKHGDDYANFDDFMEELESDL